MRILFSERIRQLRLERNMTQKSFAKFLDLPKDRISAWEQGGLPRALSLFYLSDKLNVSADFLVGRSNHR